MKKQTRSLRLSRETLRRLDDQNLTPAAGGAAVHTYTCDTCFVSCGGQSCQRTLCELCDTEPCPIQTAPPAGTLG